MKQPVQARAILFTAPNQVELGAVSLPLPGPGQVLTRTLFTGVSTGTETRVLAGNERGCQFPLIPGYENVGEVLAVGPGVSLAVGMRVFVRSPIGPVGFGRCWGAQMSHTLANESEVLVLPPQLDPAVGLYAKTGGIAYHGIRRGRVAAGESVAVVGLGLIGHLAVQAAAALGALVIGIDLEEARLEAAQKAGAAHVLPATMPDLVGAVRAVSGGGVDVAVDVTGVSAVVDQTIRLLRPRPWVPPMPGRTRLVILGSYPDPVAFSYHPSLFDLEPDILPSRDCTQEDMAAVLSLLAGGKMDPGWIPAQEFSYQSAPEVYQALQAKTFMRAIFRWG